MSDVGEAAMAELVKESGNNGASSTTSKEIHIERADDQLTPAQTSDSSSNNNASRASESAYDSGDDTKVTMEDSSVLEESTKPQENPDVQMETDESTKQEEKVEEEEQQNVSKSPPKRGRGRPPKAKSTSASPTKKTSPTKKAATAEGKEEPNADVAEKLEKMDVESHQEETPATPVKKGRGRPPKTPATPANTSTPSDAGVSGTAGRGRGRGRARAPSSGGGGAAKKAKHETPQNKRDTPAKQPGSTRGRRRSPLSYTHFVPADFEGDRVLSCGEGEQLGHPGRTTTKKPRAVDTLPEGTKFRQVVAGGVHSLLLTSDGEVFSCGINEKGTVPVEGVEAEGSTDRFTRIAFSADIQRHGKIVQLTAGASFSAALTEKGSVIAWGNLRDSSGSVEVHEKLRDMQKAPLVIIHHKHHTIVKIAAGENHLAMLAADGRVLTFGEGSVGQLGRTTRTSLLRASRLVEDSGSSLVIGVREHGKMVLFKNVWAAGFWTIVRADDDRVFVFGLNNFSQLGIETPPEPTNEDGEKASEEERDLRILMPKLSPELSKHHWTHLDGVQHVVGRTDNGEVWALGKNTDNALGLGSWTGQDDEQHWKYEELQRVMGWKGRAAGVTARLASSMVWTEDGELWAWGCDTTGQLGLGIKDDDDEKVVATPRHVTSAHLDGYKVISASLADTHALFLAKKL